MDWTKNEILDLIGLSLEYEPLDYPVFSRITLPKGKIVFGNARATLMLPVGYTRRREAAQAPASPLKQKILACLKQSV